MYRPIQIKRNMRYGNNYWETYSPKLNRNVKFFSDLEYDHWLHIETDPNVISFCEQPLEIKTYYDRKIATSILDMWVLYKDNTEEFIEVKYSSEIDGSSSKSTRSLRQINIQKKWCLENNFNYSIRTEEYIRNDLINLNNLRQIISQVKSISNINYEHIHSIVSLLIDRPLSIYVISKLSNLSMSYIIQLICWLRYKGICEFIKPELDINGEMEVKLIE